MAILLLADHDNATLSDQTAKALTAASQIARSAATCMCWWQARVQRLRPTPLQNCPAFPRFCSPKATTLPITWLNRWPR
jgi:hypothetical protein